MKVSAIDVGALQDQKLGTVLTNGVDHENRTIYMVGEVDDDMLYRVVVGFQLLDATPGPIRVILSSSGGSEPAGFALYDLFKLARNPVTIDCYGTVMSIAAMVLQAATKRRLARECRFMMHNGHIDIAGQLDTRTLTAVGKEAGFSNTRYQAIIAARAHREQSAIKDLCDREVYLSAEEAIAAGFADEVIDKAPAVNPEHVVVIEIDPDTIEKVARKSRKRRKK